VNEISKQNCKIKEHHWPHCYTQYNYSWTSDLIHKILTRNNNGFTWETSDIHVCRVSVVNCEGTDNLIGSNRPGWLVKQSASRREHKASLRERIWGQKRNRLLNLLVVDGIMLQWCSHSLLFEFLCIISLYYIKNQRDATLIVRLLVTARSLYMFLTPSASIIRSTKNCSNSHWFMSWGGCLLATDLWRPYWIYIIPTHDMNQWLLLHFLVLLMMDAESVQNM
jgi:hypothetical protein